MVRLKGKVILPSMLIITNIYMGVFKVMGKVSTARARTLVAMVKLMESMIYLTTTALPPKRSDSWLESDSWSRSCSWAAVSADGAENTKVMK